MEETNGSEKNMTEVFILLGVYGGLLKAVWGLNNERGASVNGNDGVGEWYEMLECVRAG